MSNTEENTEIEPQKRRISKKTLFKYVILTYSAVMAGYIHYKYVSTLFENVTNFSHLSDMEREMSLKTEMGFYYSYYKTVVQERPFMAGITKLMYDKLVEHPKEVNAFNRFNIYPELIIGAVYRYFEPTLNATRQCHLVDRGEGLTPVESCIGIGQPILFYLEAVWLLAGVMVAGVFLQAVALSETFLGGVLAVLQYFANHVECTRVQWSPNERENMAGPLLMLQAWLVSLQLRRKGPSCQSQITIFVLNCLCLLFWQFSQFIFLTQTAIFFVMEQLKIIDIKTLCVLLHSHFCGLHLAVLLLQGNDMLKSSLYASFFLVISAYCLFFSSLRIKVESRCDLFLESFLVMLRILIVIIFSVYLKKIISDFLGVEEDTHIWEILYSKFTNYKTFHTLLYTCSDVFDFYPLKIISKLFLSFLIPYTFISIFNVCFFWLKNAHIDYKKESEIKDKKHMLEKDKKSDDEDSGIENTETVKNRKKHDLDVITKGIKTENEEKEISDNLILFLNHFNIDAAIFYSISQLFVYGIMAGLVMRLQFLFVPQMCVVSSLILNKKYYRLPKNLEKYVPILWIIIFIPIILALLKSTKEELSQISEFSDINQEELYEWILKETNPAAAFAGSMPLMATLLLVTRRPIVLHPHYEHLNARERTYAVYKMYGKFSSEEYYEELNKLKVSYIIVETKYCYGKSAKGCSLQGIWDIEAPVQPSQATICHTLLHSPVEHYYPVFRNQQYAVFKLHDYSIKYMPRSFDT